MTLPPYELFDTDGMLLTFSSAKNWEVSEGACGSSTDAYPLTGRFAEVENFRDKLGPDWVV